ncbi:hypothetical protein BJ912DRAFT_1089301 [Pholiota molesta]|nr:hypothetical protein BJ912DRAFT_1089301 [Pholiota molesta]
MFTAPTALPHTNDEGRGGESKGRPGSGRPTRYAPLRIPPSLATDHDPSPQPPCMPTTCYGQPPPLATCPPATSCHVTRPRRPAAALAHNSNGPAPPAPSSRGGPAPLATSCRGARTRHHAATPTHDDGSVRTRRPPPATSSRGARHDNHGSPPLYLPAVPVHPARTTSPATSCRGAHTHTTTTAPHRVRRALCEPHRSDTPPPAPAPSGGLSEGTCGYTCEYPSGSADDGYTYPGDPWEEIFAGPGMAFGRQNTRGLDPGIPAGAPVLSLNIGVMIHKKYTKEKEEVGR